MSFWSLEIVLEALFKCMIFFWVDLCNTDITCLSFAIESSTFLSLISLSIAFNWVATLDLTLLLQLYVFQIDVIFFCRFMLWHVFILLTGYSSNCVSNLYRFFYFCKVGEKKLNVHFVLFFTA